jgi:uncharacterized cupin superfamily protein
VPPHTHPEQDEFRCPLGGDIDVLFDGVRSRVTAGEVGHLPKGRPHALYRRIHHMANLRRVSVITPACGVVFEPPISSAA